MSMMWIFDGVLMPYLSHSDEKTFLLLKVMVFSSAL